ncbi:hypothetical protein CDAR_528011 [Caerostris darwini]|uniref:Uncharacterized protein n=1 Tax=Caerostris darwini TaxID=1538125 RepID=A0AAV4QW16_9ARAC|nr:hypothetical protein CDAR_528011 [Caerostris darwini]
MPILFPPFFLFMDPQGHVLGKGLAETLSHSLRWTLTMCNMPCHPRFIIWPSNTHTYCAPVRTADGSRCSSCQRMQREYTACEYPESGYSVQGHEV